MIDTSAAYKAAISADARRMVPKVEVYFDGDTQPATTFQGEDVVSINLLEESRAVSNNPLGLVSANEVTISFDNSNRDFTPTNPAGAYYGKLKPNVKVVPYLGLVLPDTSIEYIPLGVFRTGDWSSPSSSVEATVTCYDRLYLIGDQDVPMLPVKQGTTIGEMFVDLFTALGLTSAEYNIDASLNQAVAIGWLPKGKVRNALQVLAVAGNCSVTADRYGVIRVRSNFVTGTSVETWTDNNQVITAENPQKYLDCYSKVNVNYYQPYIKPSDSLLKIENLTIPNGGIKLVDVAFTAGPVAVVDQVRLIGAKNADISSIQFGAWTTTIAISNTAEAESVTLEIIGRIVDSMISTYKIQDDEAIDSFGDKTFPVKNYLIQNLNVAKNYAVELLQYVKDPLANITVTARGNPALEIGDVIEIQNPTDKIGTVDIVPYRFGLNYDGALNAKLEARKVSANTRYTWAYVGPGLYEYVSY